MIREGTAFECSCSTHTCLNVNFSSGNRARRRTQRWHTLPRRFRRRTELYVLDFASKAFQQPKHFAEARHRSLIFALHRRSGARRRFGRRAGPANGCGCARAMPKQELDTDLALLLGRGHTPLSLEKRERKDSIRFDSVGSYGKR